ncbi:MAG: metallophosphoesterase family protein, partial [Planctomycetota bacterium]
MTPVTRRDFLKKAGSTVALATACSLGANTSGADLGKPLFDFIIDADPHAGIDRESEDTGRGKFRTVVHKVQQLSVQPDFMLILGDVHGPVKEVLAETDFQLPIHVVFGNADDGSSRRALRAMFDDDFGQNDYYAFTHKRCKFIGICNAVPGDHVGHLNSEFYRGLRQCSWLE